MWLNKWLALIAFSVLLLVPVGAQNAFAVAGDFIDDFVSAGSGGLIFPHGLVFGPDGNLYVISGSLTNQVLQYNGKTGEFLGDFVSANSGGLSGPEGLVFGPDRNLYVSSGGTDQVLQYNGKTGEFLDDFVSAGSGDLDSPRGLVFGPDGNLYVSSAATNEVLRYDGLFDSDDDGFFTDVDCDDFNDTIFPGALEIPGDTIDQDCDGSDIPLFCGAGTTIEGNECVPDFLSICGPGTIEENLMCVISMVIGGTFLEIDKFPLFLAALHITVSWMAPVVISGIGLGIAIIILRNNR